MALQINTVQMEIGVRVPKTITIYPLSMADEIKLTNKIASYFQQYQNIKTTAEPIDENDDDFVEKMLSQDDSIDPQFVIFVIKAIEENLIDILKMVCEEEVTLNDITNDQFADLCNLIFDMNFAGTVGKFKSLLTKIRSSFQQTKQ